MSIAARRAQLEDYTVAGKTGTARKIVDGHYSYSKHLASFVGFLPQNLLRFVSRFFSTSPKDGLWRHSLRPGIQVDCPKSRQLSEPQAQRVYLPADQMPEELVVQSRVNF